MIPDKISEEEIEEILRLSEQGQTQEQVAEKVGVSRATVSRYLKKKKDSLKPKILRRFSMDEINSLCELVTPLILEKLGNQNPDNKNEDKEEKEMGDEVGTKVQEALDRKAMLDRLNELTSLKDDIQTIKANQDGISDLCKRFPGLCEKVEDIQEQVKTNIDSVKTLCEQFPGLCSTQEKIESRLAKEQANKVTGVLGTNLTLGELLESEKSQENLVNKYIGPTGLLFALERCTGPECEEIRRIAREKGINIQVKGQGGMLGSSGWKDID